VEQAPSIKTGSNSRYTAIPAGARAGVIEDWDSSLLREYRKLCAWTLAKAHARSGDSAQIAGHMGSNETFDDAICEFAVEYADQNQRDYRLFIKAVGEGLLKAPFAS
jgi:hypothetical protein